jgi:hypothetical protein
MVVFGTLSWNKYPESHICGEFFPNVLLLVNRDATADTQRLLSSMSWIYSLVRAIEAACDNLRSDLAREARSQYTAVGQPLWQAAIRRMFF